MLPKATGAALALRAPPVLEVCRWLGSSAWNELRCVLLKPLLPGVDLDGSLWFFHSEAALMREPAKMGGSFFGGAQVLHWG